MTTEQEITERNPVGWEEVYARQEVLLETVRRIERNMQEIMKAWTQGGARAARTAARSIANGRD